MDFFRGKNWTRNQILDSICVGPKPWRFFHESKEPPPNHLLLLENKTKERYRTHPPTQEEEEEEEGVAPWPCHLH